MLGTFLIILASIIVQRAMTRLTNFKNSVSLDMAKTFSNSIFDESRLEFSGSTLINNNYWWTLVTASLIHASQSHEINNILFTIPVSLTIEYTLQYEQEYAMSRLGSCIFVLVLFAITGIFGWLASFQYNKYKHGDVGLWIVSRGMSPNMYGMALFHGTLLPNCEWDSCYVLKIDPWIWLFMVVFIPDYFNKKFNKILLLLLILSTLIFYYKFEKELFANMTSLLFITGYLGFGILHRLYYSYVLKIPGASDHASHFGGSFAGFVIALILFAFYHGFIAMVHHLLSLLTQWKFIFCWIFLWIRMYFNK